MRAESTTGVFSYKIIKVSVTSATYSSQTIECCFYTNFFYKSHGEVMVSDWLWFRESMGIPEDNFIASYDLKLFSDAGL